MQEGTGALRSGLVQLSEGSLLAVEAKHSDPHKYMTSRSPIRIKTS